MVWHDHLLHVSSEGKYLVVFKLFTFWKQVFLHDQLVFNSSVRSLLEYACSVFMNPGVSSEKVFRINGSHCDARRESSLRVFLHAAHNLNILSLSSVQRIQVMRVACDGTVLCFPFPRFSLGGSTVCFSIINSPFFLQSCYNEFEDPSGEIMNSWVENPYSRSSRVRLFGRERPSFTAPFVAFCGENRESARKIKAFLLRAARSFTDLRGPSG